LVSVNCGQLPVLLKSWTTCSTTRSRGFSILRLREPRERGEGLRDGPVPRRRAPGSFLAIGVPRTARLVFLRFLLLLRLHGVHRGRTCPGSDATCQIQHAPRSPWNAGDELCGLENRGEKAEQRRCKEEDSEHASDFCAAQLQQLFSTVFISFYLDYKQSSGGRPHTARTTRASPRLRRACDTIAQVVRASESHGATTSYRCVAVHKPEAHAHAQLKI
jgi:hypothetical protein